MSPEIELAFHGAAQTVTGSCMELSWHGRRLLVDCGLFQGTRSLEWLNHGEFPFQPGQIDAVILTHAHIDHSGLLPRLVAEGFSGPIWCTAPTRDLLAYMLPDAARIQMAEVERRNRRADRADEPHHDPLYTEADAELAISLVRTVNLGDWFEPVPDLRARYWNAGHILGSGSVEIRNHDLGILFSGDLGPEYKAFHPDPEAPSDIDYVVCESTYGDRERPTVTIEQRRNLLEGEIKAALARGGNLVIPVFAVERTQELLLDIASLINAGRIANHPVFIDSPLASRATSVFAQHADSLEDMNGENVFRHPNFHFVEDAQASMRLNTMSGAIIMSASGMCEAGRIRHHLVHNLPRANSTVMFVGYQAPGTLGRVILDGAKRVRISGKAVAVKAHVTRIDSYSAHADRSDLLGWIRGRMPIRGSLFLDHGEPLAIASLRETLAHEIPSIITPAIGERYVLAPGAHAKRIATGRIDVQAAVSRDWQNDYADFAVNLKKELMHIRDAHRRQEALRQMKRVLDQYRDHREGHPRTPAPTRRRNRR